jgi:tetratricopeptide (TPR) repeat protein
MRLTSVFSGVSRIAFAILVMIPLATPTEASDAPAKPVAGTISADLLRYRLSYKAQQMLQAARRAVDANDHALAIRRLQQTLAKYPESAAWTQSMLGVEYLKIYQLPAALASLEQAVQLLPRDAVNRSNLGLALVLTGQYDRAETELRLALELSHPNAKTKELLDALIAARATHPTTDRPTTDLASIPH